MMKSRYSDVEKVEACLLARKFGGERSIASVARRMGVAEQTVHYWCNQYRDELGRRSAVRGVEAQRKHSTSVAQADEADPTTILAKSLEQIEQRRSQLESELRELDGRAQRIRNALVALGSDARTVEAAQ